MSDTRVERRLSAILAADVVGYSRLMGIDEEGTLAALKTCRRELLDPKIAECRGRVVKTTGDGALVEFASAVDAVRCAMDIQRGMAERNIDVPEDRRIVFRIGINVGDIIIDEGDIYGDGVNIASRVETLASPGAICLSDNAYQQVKGKLPLDVSDMGEQQLKNIAQPVKVFSVRLNSVVSAAASVLALPDKPSIAVLPFQNMSGDPEQEYFADGMVEDIITALSRFKNLFVIARNSSFTYKGRAVDVKQVGRELGVRYVLEGSVRKAANRVRITGQLIDASSGAHLWADRFHGAFDDIFDLQDQVTVSVVGAIAPKLEQAEIERARRKRPDSLDAYDLLLRALPHVNANTPADGALAIPLLESALVKDPRYATAHGCLAWCLEQRFMRAGFEEDVRSAALRHARAAIADGADDANALTMGGFVLGVLAHEQGTALGAFNQAIALNGNSMLAYSLSSVFRAFTGDFVLATEHSARALRLSPFDLLRYNSYLALAFINFISGRFGDAVAAAMSGLQANPAFTPMHAFLIASQVGLGRIEDGKASAARLLELAPGFTVGGFAKMAFTRAEWIEALASGLRRAGLPE
jgi:adenylate cyclase